jgi:hypothetical protein
LYYCPNIRSNEFSYVKIWEAVKLLKSSIIFIVLSVFLLLTFGCPPEQTQPLETPQIEPVQPQIAQLQPPVETEPAVQPSVEAEPSAQIPAETEPEDQQPAEIETTTVEVNEPDPKNMRIEEPKVPDANVFHNICAELLNDFVDENGMVDYKNLKRKKYLLKDVLNQFDSFDPNVYNAWPEEEKIAFWINAYNMQLLKIIIDNYPIESKRIFRLIWPPTSIRHIQGIWDMHKFIVMEEEFTLDELEKTFFRQKFNEPRVFFAISRASLSSPSLRNEPYYGYKLSEQLDDQTKKFLASPLALEIDREKQRVYLSSMLQPTWLGKEFIKKYGTDKKFKDQLPATRAALNFITKYIDPKDVSFLETANYSVKYLPYDWRLNE